MTHRDLDKVSSAAAPERAEVSAAIDLLLEEVAHLALSVKLVVAALHASKAELHGKSVSDGAAQDANEAVDQREVETKTADTVCYVKMVEMSDAANISLSPRNDNSSDRSVRSEPDTLPEHAVKEEAALSPPDHRICPEENALAARLVELHERLGGFVKH